jgi:hypothetical protein
MTVTRAFDTAQFVPSPGNNNVNDGALISSVGPPFATAFKPVVVGSQPGVTVGASMPAATAQNQILISGAGPGFAWALGTNPAAAASVPPPTAPNQVIVADAVPSWQPTTANALVLLGGACMLASGGNFAAAAKLTFTTTASVNTCIDGVDPTLSQIDNFLLDCGTF